MTSTIQTSANSYAVVVGQIIDHSRGSLKHVSEFLWEGINCQGSSKKFKTKQEAIHFAAN